MSWHTTVDHLVLVVAAVLLAAVLVGGCALKYDVGAGSVEVQRIPSESSSISSPQIQPEPSSIRQAKR